MRTLIAMDAPPAQEDCRPYVAVAALLARGRRARAAVHAQDLVARVSCCSPISARAPIVDALDDATAPALYRDACGALIRWQLASRDGVLPRYDEAMLARELELFPDWYVAQASRRHAERRAARHARRGFSHGFSTTIWRSRVSTCIATITRAT